MFYKRVWGCCQLIFHELWSSPKQNKGKLLISIYVPIRCWRWVGAGRNAFSLLTTNHFIHMDHFTLISTFNIRMVKIEDQKLDNKCFQNFNHRSFFIENETYMIWLQTGTKIIYNLVIKDFGVFFLSITIRWIEYSFQIISQ